MSVIDEILIGCGAWMVGFAIGLDERIFHSHLDKPPYLLTWFGWLCLAAGIAMALFGT